MKTDRPSIHWGWFAPRLLTGLAACGLVVVLALPAAAEKRPGMAPPGLAGPGMGPMGGMAGGAPASSPFRPMMPGGRIGDGDRGVPGMAGGFVPHNPMGFGAPGEPGPNPWEAASIPREVVLEWAMAATPAGEDLPGLEALLEKAYETNPQVIEAQAQLQQAQAAVERARMEVARQIVRTRAQWEVRRRAVQCLSDALKKTPDDDKLLQQYVDARAKLAQIEMELPYLGQAPPKQGRLHRVATPPTWDPYGLPGAGAPNPRAGMLRPGSGVAENPPYPAATASPEIRKALQTTLDANFTQVPLAEVIAYLREKTGVNFFMADTGMADELVVLQLKSVTLAALLQALEDGSGTGLKCFVRPYGILVTNRDYGDILSESQAVRVLHQSEPGNCAVPCDPCDTPNVAAPDENPPDDAPKVEQPRRR
ncbi:MAG: hypothetical protein JW719_07865 [Pirellulales bacterium]|nr:hypothetical protein [Pirellulales bacterium]